MPGCQGDRVPNTRGRPPPAAEARAAPPEGTKALSMDTKVFVQSPAVHLSPPPPPTPVARLQKNSHAGGGAAGRARRPSAQIAIGRGESAWDKADTQAWGCKQRCGY